MKHEKDISEIILDSLNNKKLKKEENLLMKYWLSQEKNNKFFSYMKDYTKTLKESDIELFCNENQAFKEFKTRINHSKKRQKARKKRYIIMILIIICFIMTIILLGLTSIQS
ncbi:MAG: hypothetical protein N4A49_05695 [Marinifilaceae bacterium]|jgi:hypothetical protein|nr:hypothetical protein [Marinifilaceae bacterium]